MDELTVFDNALPSARELFELGQYAGVVAICCQALQQQPGDVPLLLLRARAFRALGHVVEAVQDLRAVVVLDPLCGSAYLALGRLMIDGGELLAARRASLAALEVDPRDRRAREQLQEIDAALIVEEALALEEALADEELVAADGEAAPRHRLATQPMGRTLLRPRASGSGSHRAVDEQALAARGLSTSSSSAQDAGAPDAAIYRAVTRAVARRAETAPLVPARSSSSTPYGRAATTPMARRVATSPLYGRSATDTAVDSMRLTASELAFEAALESALEATRPTTIEPGIDPRVVTVELPR